MKLGLFAEFAVFFKLELTFALCVHVYLVPLRYVVLVFTDGTD